MEELNIRELRGIAEKATPGPWVATECLDVWVESDDGIAIAQCGDFHWVGADGIVNTEEQMKANARFFTTFDPPTVLALLSSAEAREEAQARVADWTERLQAICEQASCPPGLNRFDFIANRLAALQSAEARAREAEAFVRVVGRLTMTGDDGWTPPDDPDDAQAALDSLITKARDLMAAMPARQALGASHG
jgi:hypothetical protein